MWICSGLSRARFHLHIASLRSSLECAIGVLPLILTRRFAPRSFVLSGVMVFSPETLFGGFGWYNDPKLNMEISIEVLGFWWWWLFIIPSLRSRRPQGLEKQALDYAFLTTPLASLVMPVITRNCGVIWGVDFAVVLACYAVAFGGGGGGEIKKEGLAGWIFKSLDFGSGKERGLRK